MDDLISRQDAIRWVKTECNPYGKPTLDFESGKKVIEHLEQMPSAGPKTDEESELRFYYVESIDDYWIGQRLDNFYYADWHEGLGFVWSKSRYLPWGEHIVNENTLWKEHTYPSEPIEIPFTEWIKGFVKKYFAEPKTDGVLEQIRWERDMALKTLEEHGIGFAEEPKTGEWILDPNGMDWNIPAWRCSECGFVATHIGVEPNGLGDSPLIWSGSKFCPQCGARITGYER